MALHHCEALLQADIRSLNNVFQLVWPNAVLMLWPKAVAFCAHGLANCHTALDDGTGIGGWAGLNGHVAIECRPPVFIDGGVGSTVEPHVQHPPVTTASAGKPLEVTVSFIVSGGSAQASVDIFDNSTGTLVASSSPSAPLHGNSTLRVTIPRVVLWSPESRALYTAVVTLGTSAKPLDSATTRFGVRSIAVDGHKLLLNGQRIFLAGGPSTAKLLCFISNNLKACCTPCSTQSSGSASGSLLSAIVDPRCHQHKVTSHFNLRRNG